MRRMGFTLFELMIVVAIVAVLGGMLMPALTTVRATGRSMTCLGNLRQYQMANEQFATEQGGFYVNLCGVGTSELVPWYANSVYRGYLDLTRTSSAYSKNRLCPDSFGARNIGAWDPIARSYGMNASNYGTSPPAGIPINLNSNHVTDPCRFRRAKVARASEKIAIADALDWWVQSQNSMSYTIEVPNGSVMLAAYRHRNGVNIAFYDGHAERRSRQQIDTSVTPAAQDQIWAVIRP